LYGFSRQRFQIEAIEKSPDLPPLLQANRFNLNRLLNFRHIVGVRAATETAVSASISTPVSAGFN